MKNNKKIFTWLMIVLLVIGAALVVWGFVAGFEANNAAATNALLNFGYCMVILALAAIIIGGIVAASGEPKRLLKTGIVLLAAAAFVFIVYLIAPGSEAIGLVSVEQPAKGMLKLTDTILYMAYFLAIGAIVAIVVGEVRMAISNKKA